MHVIDPAWVIRIENFRPLASFVGWERSIEDHVVRMFEFAAYQVVARVFLGVMLALVQRPAFTADLPICLEMHMVLLGVVKCICDRYHRKAMVCIDMKSTRADKAVDALEGGPSWGGLRRSGGKVPFTDDNIAPVESEGLLLTCQSD